LLFSDVTETIRSLTSIYQLLPRYEMIEEDGSFRRVAETVAEIPGIARAKAQDGLRFYREIDDAANARRERGYELVPIVGTWQPTLQSGRLAGGRLNVAAVAPTWTEFPAGEGDGTVPRISAVPVGMSDSWLNTFVAERHGSLQSNPAILQDLQDRIIQSQVRTGHIRGASQATPQPALSVDVEDLYAVGEPIILTAAVRNLEFRDVKEVRARVKSASHGVLVYQGQFAATGADWRIEIPSLTPGAYRVEVEAVAAGASGPAPVHDVFVVAEA
jgi:hypothetical protein